LNKIGNADEAVPMKFPVVWKPVIFKINSNKIFESNPELSLNSGFEDLMACIRVIDV
jgi:hypothetical protein